VPRPSRAPTVPCPSWKSAWQPEISELLVQQFNGYSFEFCCYHFWPSSAWIVVRRVCSLHLGFTFFQKKETRKRATGFIMCFEQEKRKENFTLCLDVWKITDKHFSYILRLDISKFGNFTALLSADNQKKNTQWRRSITTEERLALTLRLAHIPYNLLSPSSSEQLNTSQKVTTFCLTNFVNVRVVANLGRPPTARRETADVNSHIPCARAVPLPCCTVALKSRSQSGIVGARKGRDMACVNQMRSRFVNQMGTTHLATRHGVCESVWYEGSPYDIRA